MEDKEIKDLNKESEMERVSEEKKIDWKKMIVFSEILKPKFEE